MTNSSIDACCSFVENHLHHRTFFSPSLSMARWVVWNFPLETTITITLCLQRRKGGPLPNCTKYKVCCFYRFRKQHSNMRHPYLSFSTRYKENPLYSALYFNRENSTLHSIELNIFPALPSAILVKQPPISFNGDRSSAKVYIYMQNRILDKRCLVRANMRCKSHSPPPSPTT